MKKLIVVALLAGSVGFVLGNAFWYLASPLWIDRVVSESQPSASTSQVVASGEVNGADQLHQGKGSATVLDTADGTIIRFTDFEVTNGPGLVVWLVKHDNPLSSDDVTSSEWLALGSLKGNIGDQNYSVPDDKNIADYGSVVIWCEPFGVLFAAATLSPAN